MQRNGFLGSCLVALAALAVWPAMAHAGSAAVTVEADDKNKFAPKTADYISISNQFVYYWGTDLGGGGTTERRHNVMQDKGLFRSGAPRRSYDGGFKLSVSAGTFPYYCEVHGGPDGEGMSGRLRSIPSYGNGTLTDDEIPVQWADPSHTTGDQYDVRYSTVRGEWHNWRQDTDKLKGLFGRNDKPIDVAPGQTVRFKARSEKSSNPSKRSGWSPTFKATAIP